MPRPKTKSELLEHSQSQFQRLWDYVHAFSPVEQEQTFPPGTLNRNIRDVLAHLYHWHLMMLRWYKEGMQGKQPDMPANGYTWRTIPDLNRAIWVTYKETPLPQILTLVQASHERVYALINRHTEEELFEKKRYPWTGSTSLGAYLISATSSHYEWAYKLIQKAKKEALSTQV